MTEPRYDDYWSLEIDVDRIIADHGEDKTIKILTAIRLEVSDEAQRRRGQVVADFVAKETRYRKAGAKVRAGERLGLNSTQVWQNLTDLEKLQSRREGNSEEGA